MRNKLPVLIAGVLLLMKCVAPGTRRNLDAKLQALLHQKEFFKLETQLNAGKDILDAGQQLYFRAFIDNAFNRNEASVTAIDTLLNQYASQFNEAAKAALLQSQEDAYFKLFEYAKAAEIDSMLLSGYSKGLDSEKIHDIQNTLLVRKALRNTPPQRTFITNNTNIRWTRDGIGLVEIPVKHDTSTYSCIFDTRANISSITETYAARLGLQMLPVSYKQSSGATGITFKTGLGIADSLYIGNILVRHVVFQVMPDSVLYLAQLNMSLNIIIGFPVIAQLKEVHILKDGWMIIPLFETASDLHNFALNGPNPVISLLTGGDTLCFNFDLGATTTDLYEAYFERYKPRIVKEGHKKTIQYGGAGGIQKKEVYVIPSLELMIGHKKVILDSVDVLTQKIFPEEKLYGNIGNDFASQFNELILNFDKMYIKGN
ncbi:MAG: retropepsin-like aspartic protease [Ginsengibacter sp.]